MSARRIVFPAAVVLTLLVGGVVAIRAYRLRPPPKWQEPLDAALAGADRVEVYDQLYGPDPERRIIDVNGIDVVKLVQLLRIDEEHSVPMHCNCIGDFRFDFYRGDQLVAKIGFAHGSNLKWWHGPWVGDATLTLSSRAAVSGWIEQHRTDHQ